MSFITIYMGSLYLHNDVLHRAAMLALQALY